MGTGTRVTCGEFYLPIVKPVPVTAGTGTSQVRVRVHLEIPRGYPCLLQLDNSDNSDSRTTTPTYTNSDISDNRTMVASICYYSLVTLVHIVLIAMTLVFRLQYLLYYHYATSDLIPTIDTIVSSSI